MPLANLFRLATARKGVRFTLEGALNLDTRFLYLEPPACCGLLEYLPEEFPAFVSKKNVHINPTSGGENRSTQRRAPVRVGKAFV